MQWRRDRNSGHSLGPMDADLDGDARDERISELFAHRYALVRRMKLLDDREDDDGVKELLNELEANDMAIVDLSEGLVRSYVRRFLGADDRYRDDLLQAGRIGVIESIENFDRRRATWASWAMTGIRREVQKAVHSNEHPLLNDRDFQHRQRILRALSELHEERGGSMPTAGQVAKRAGVPVTSARRVIDNERSELRLDDPDGWIELELMLDAASAATQQDDNGMDDEAFARFEKATEGLSITETIVLMERLNLTNPDAVNGASPPTNAEIGSRLGMSRDKVRRTEEDAWWRIAADGYEIPEEKLGRHKGKPLPPHTE